MSKIILIMKVFKLPLFLNKSIQKIITKKPNLSLMNKEMM